MAEPVRVIVATVGLVRVTTGVRPAGTLETNAWSVQRGETKVSPVRVTVSPPETVPLLAAVSVKVVFV